MEKKSNKILVFTIVLSIFLNLIFAINYFVVKQNKKSDLIQTVQTILYELHNADSLLNDGNDSTSDYETRIILATLEITKSRSLVDTHAKDLPRNFVSWIGGVELGLSNGALGVDESGFRSSVQDLKNFNDGFEKEAQNLQQNHTEILKIIEDVLSSQEYMGDNYMSK
ncbi:hypothetical protein [Sporosarcina sp. BP05]|uniref:hypothetical protein n=1 Tax=Sporosarcina sp. BP05 TaxID=2758726 RepID=UPI0016448145|nr:hypothetical protein [Sporosarcina sp. BP05]